MRGIAQLLKEFSDHLSFPVKVDLVKDWIIENSYQEEINFYPVDMDPNKLKGVFLQYRSDIGPMPRHYEERLIRVAQINYAEKLNRCWERFVCCKEMMHVFDPKDSWTTTPDQIKALTSNLSIPTPSLDENGKPSRDIVAEKMAMFFALHVLAPMETVEQIRPSYETGDITDHEVALFFRIPETYIPVLFEISYKQIYTYIMKHLSENDAP